MAEPSERARALAESAVDGEGLGPEVLDRIARAVDRGWEEVARRWAEQAYEEQVVETDMEDPDEPKEDWIKTFLVALREAQDV